MIENSASSVADGTRVRTVTWQDPALGYARGRELSGIEWLRAIFDGTIPWPPVGVLLGIDQGDVEPGRVWMSLPVGEHLYNPLLVVHGGVLSTGLDTVMACAIHSTLAAGEGYTTVDLHVTFVRAVTAASGRIRFEGEVVHPGRRVATAQGRVLDEQGRLCAHAITTCMILRPEAEGGRS